MRYISMLLTIFAVLFPVRPDVNAAQRPHLVVMLADDLGWGDVGYHGSPITTPHIDRLAERGVQLNQGKTAVSFRFEPASLRHGWWLMGIALVMMITAMVWGTRRTPLDPPSSNGGRNMHGSVRGGGACRREGTAHE